MLASLVAATYEAAPSRLEASIERSKVDIDELHATVRHHDELLVQHAARDEKVVDASAYRHDR